MEVCDIVQEAGIKTISKKKKCKKAKWLSEEVLQTPVKRIDVRGKGEKESYIHLNIKFQRIVRRHKKTFLSDQCKEIEENNRMGKTRDLFKKIRDTKGTFHAKMGTIKDRNDIDLTEAEDIKKRWQEYTEELYKQNLHDPDNHDGIIAYLEPDILECDVKWALGFITYKTSNQLVQKRNKASPSHPEDLPHTWRHDKSSKESDMTQQQKWTNWTELQRKRDK